MPSLADFDRYLPSAWTMSALEATGYVGWHRFTELPSAVVPRAGGVYVVTRGASDDPAFFAASPAGWFKGKDPTVSATRLRKEWVVGAEVMYIGKADNLRDRLDLYRRFGQGEPVMHWGGRLIWQLEDAGELRVRWYVTGDADPEDVEFVQLEQFRDLNDSRLPFANLRRGRLPSWFEPRRRIVFEAADRDARSASVTRAIDALPPELMTSPLASDEEWR